mmetsp:Transcript_6005/g.13338  ORF Transcript_6005/g.13338 Transcript_6005/m.13338 type:complete len:352 (-) Transcript_6005:429-1484(-)
MLSTLFESEYVRNDLLQAFAKNIGMSTPPRFTTNNLGLWATFLSRIGINPKMYSSIKHCLLECSFLNTAFDFYNTDRLLIHEKQAKSHSYDCVMIPCTRNGKNEFLISQGYRAVPSFFHCYSKLEDSHNWREHIKENMIGQKYKTLIKPMDSIDSLYTTKWITIQEFVCNTPLLKNAMAIYVSNAQKFEYPAIHYNEDLLRYIASSSYGQNFYVGLTFRENTLYIVMIGFMDRASSYFSFLVMGINYNCDKMISNHNLYKYAVFLNYKFIEEHNLKLLDLGRGFVEQKMAFGINNVDLLYTYLKPLTQAAEDYVSHIVIKSKSIINVYEQKYLALLQDKKKKLQQSNLSTK